VHASAALERTAKGIRVFDVALSILELLAQLGSRPIGTARKDTNAVTFGREPAGDRLTQHSTAANNQRRAAHLVSLRSASGFVKQPI
jgi:hypothetical protein